jgi:hypothetical protein
MKPDWAEENLQTIRTLMERSAIYRRALAPIMIFAGLLGVASAALGLLCHLNSSRTFIMFWLGVAVITIAGAFLIARRQALKDSEKFWSPPTRRVALALAPPLLAGLCVGGIPIFFPDADKELDFGSTIAWVMFYGCALHAAGFFMPRGIKIFGWIFITSASCFFYLLALGYFDLGFSAHWLMGVFFGVLHLAYGAYLYLTEGKSPVA